MHFLCLYYKIPKTSIKLIQNTLNCRSTNRCLQWYWNFDTSVTLWVDFREVLFKILIIMALNSFLTFKQQRSYLTNCFVYFCPHFVVYSCSVHHFEWRYKKNNSRLSCFLYVSFWFPTGSKIVLGFYFCFFVFSTSFLSS